MLGYSGLAGLCWYYIILAVVDCVLTLVSRHLGLGVIIQVLDLFLSLCFPLDFYFFSVSWPGWLRVLVTHESLGPVEYLIGISVACMIFEILCANVVSGAPRTSVASRNAKVFCFKGS